VTSTSWVVPSPASKYGGAFTTASAPTKDNSPLVSVAGPSPESAGMDSLLHPGGPMLWVGVLLAGMVGLAAVSTTVRVGPLKASAELGNG
jgi:hypothetical protein